ncbi:hypothetical protein IQ07DRAFT_591482 [Pyrenochaeta sp. DS3sAY3a]|nr:hypothetical protein IQ07DRAFT_591482 [Pyrenochaeta sp. DS3sAY3a]
MKISILYLSAIAQAASAHYFFNAAIVNGVTQANDKYVRQSTRPTKYNPIKFSSNPAADLRDGSTADGPDIVCNQGAFSSAGRTDVLTVNAGEEVRLKLAVGATMQHPGPALVYMSKAPSSVKSYDGINGDWFKIFQEGVCTGSDFTKDAWCTWDRDWVAAKIPKDTPNGEYLVRFEHIGIHRSHVNQPEHYVSCLQVKVQNGGTGTPGPVVKFPGAYKATDPYANFSIYGGKKDFPMPGPAVWTGGAVKDITASPSASPVPSTSSPKPSTTAAPVSSPSPTASKPPPSTAAPVASPAPSSFASNGALSKEFTLHTFIAWLQKIAGGSVTRRHARHF